MFCNWLFGANAKTQHLLAASRIHLSIFEPPSFLASLLFAMHNFQLNSCLRLIVVICMFVVLLWKVTLRKRSQYTLKTATTSSSVGSVGWSVEKMCERGDLVGLGRMIVERRFVSWAPTHSGRCSRRACNREALWSDYTEFSINEKSNTSRAQFDRFETEIDVADQAECSCVR